MERHATDHCEEMEQLIPSQVNQVRAVLKGEHNLVIPEECDKFIARCLRVKDGSIQDAIKLVGSILAFRVIIANLKSWNVALMPSAYWDVHNLELAKPLKNTDSSGSRILIMRAGPWDPQKRSSTEILALFWMTMQYAQSELLEAQRNGLVIIADFSNVTLRHALAAQHTKILTMMKWMQNGVMGRFKEIHSINHPKVVDLIYKAVKPILTEKMKRRMIFHDSVESLLNHVGADNLPTFIGGSLDPKDCIDRELVDRFPASDPYFQDMLQFGFPSK